MNQRGLLNKLGQVCKVLEQEFILISDERKEVLLLLSNFISSKYKSEQIPCIIVICTHNSRRSHIGQLWLAVGADYYQLPAIQTFSGGTEATAFNPRAVKALKRIGFQIIADEAKAKNPIYQVRWSESMLPYQAFSKKYEDAPNPTDNFAAIMVCTQADEGCPVVLGCDARISIPYDDPKAYDGTELEAAKYDERVREIGREMLYVLSQIEKK